MPARPRLPARQRVRRGSLAERGPFCGAALGELVWRESLGIAEVDLDEAVIEPQGEAGRLDGWRGRPSRAAERRRDDRVELRIHRPGPEPGGLPEPVARERDIGVARVAVLGVPDRLAVPRQEERRHPSTPISLL